MPHLLICPEIVRRAKLKNSYFKVTFEPEWIYGSIEQQLKIVQVFQEMIACREEVIVSQARDPRAPMREGRVNSQSYCDASSAIYNVCT